MKWIRIFFLPLTVVLISIILSIISIELVLRIVKKDSDWDVVRKANILRCLVSLDSVLRRNGFLSDDMGFSRVKGLNLKLAVGTDGRNRCMLSPFASKTGRNQPSNAKFVFGPAKWVRFFIKPEDGMALAYVDYSQQEFGIAAALSGDKAMKEAYQSGDPYITFAKQSGAVPNDATPETHPRERAQFKTCALGTLYGLGPEGMAQKLNQPVETGRQLLRHHQNCYQDFWKWSHDTVATALLRKEMQTVMGWNMKVPPRINAQQGPNMRSLANFPMQANGSEMLRVAVIKAHELGVEICATVHDALLIQAPLESIEKKAQDTQHAMEEASELILNGFRLKTDTEVIKWPDRYFDERGAGMWSKIMNLLE